MKAHSLIAFICFALAAVRTGASPVNDNFGDATTLVGFPITRITSNIGATWEVDEPDHEYNTPAQASIWYRWTAPELGLATVSTAGSSFDTVLAVYTGDALANLQWVASNDEADENDSTSLTKFVAQPGVTYWIAIDGYFGDTGRVVFSLALQTGLTVPPNDNIAAATVLTGGSVEIDASNILATHESGELTPSVDGRASVWFVWEAPTAERYAINTANSDFDTILGIYSEQTLVAWNDDSDGRTSAVRFKTQAGVRYYISVQGYGTAMGSIHLQIRPAPPVPAPPFALLDMNGAILQSSDLAGKVVILDFWATWCGPCVAEIPDFINMQNKYGPDGFVIVGVSTDATGFDVVIPFVNEHGVNYISTVSNYDIENDYGPIEFIPTTYIINREGKIEERLVGQHSRAAFDAILLPLIYPTIEVTLQYAREGDELVLTWPAAATGYTLQASAGFSTPANWSPIVGVTISGDNNVARIPITEGNRWFRLAHN